MSEATAVQTQRLPSHRRMAAQKSPVRQSRRCRLPHQRHSRRHLRDQKYGQKDGLAEGVGQILSHFHLFLQASLQAVEAVFQRLVDMVSALALASRAAKIVKLNEQLA